MKLVLAIVNDEDANRVITGLSKNGYGVTKLAATGGFLKSGNVTILIGTDDEKVQNVIDIIKEKSQQRTQLTSTPMPIGVNSDMNSYPIEVRIGGATIFVLDVDRFEKV